MLPWKSSNIMKYKASASISLTGYVVKYDEDEMFLQNV